MPSISVYSGFSKKPNSTARPTGAGTSKTCVFKDDVSVVSPVFILDGVDTSINYVIYNSRYYFVRDIVLQNRNIMELHCEIDVLATWKSQIGSSSQYVLRSSAASDGRITDMFYPAKKEPVIKSKTLTNVTAPAWASSIDSGCFVVGIIGPEYDPLHDYGFKQGAVTYYAFDPLNFQSFTSALFTETNWTNFTSADRYSFNPIQYISSVMWFPYWPSVSSGNKSHVKVGWEDIFAVCKTITSPVSTHNYSVSFDKHPQAAARGAYLNAGPYSEYCITFPPFGTIVMDPDVCATSSLMNVIHKTDFVTGKSMLVGREVFTGGMFEYFRREVQIGVSIQIAQIAANRLGVAKDIVSTAGGVIGSLMTGNVVGAITSAASGIISGLQGVQPHAQTTGSNDSLISVLGFGVSPFLFERYYEIVDEDNTNHGRPLCQVKTISSIAGYILCANSEVSITGTLEEKERIQRYMDGGFFYE